VRSVEIAKVYNNAQKLLRRGRINDTVSFNLINPMNRFLTIVLLVGPALPAAGSTEILVAIRNGDYAQVSKLLRAGADPNTSDSDGTTALMHSVIESDLKMMKLLLDRGARVNAKTRWTPRR
jgi:ankyrin repeat protein